MPKKKISKKRMPRKQVPDAFKMSLGLAGFALAVPIATQALRNLNTN